MKKSDRKVYIFTNSYPEPSPVFSTEEMEFVQKNYPNIKICSFSKYRAQDEKKLIRLNIWGGIKAFFGIKKYSGKEIYKIFRHCWHRKMLETAKNLYSFFLALDFLDNADLLREDLLYSYWFSRSSRIVYYIHKITGNRFVCQGHGSDIYIYPPEDMGSILKASTKIFTIGESGKRYICNKWDVSNSKVDVFRLGVGEKFFSDICSVERYDIGKRIFLTVGALSAVKGIDVLLEAVKKIYITNIEKLNNMVFHIYGEGECRHLYEKFIKDNDLDSIIVLKGYGSREQIAKAMTNAYAYILPSRSEGLPVVLMEACAASLPIIATNVGSVSEIAVEGENAFLIEPDRVELLERAILDLIALSEDRITEMKQHSFERYCSEYILEKNLDNKYSLIMSL